MANFMQYIYQLPVCFSAKSLDTDIDPYISICSSLKARIPDIRIIVYSSRNESIQLFLSNTSRFLCLPYKLIDLRLATQSAKITSAIRISNYVINIVN